MSKISIKIVVKEVLGGGGNDDGEWKYVDVFVSSRAPRLGIFLTQPTSIRGMDVVVKELGCSLSSTIFSTPTTIPFISLGEGALHRRFRSLLYPPIRPRSTQTL